MDVHKIIDELRSERERIDTLILAFEQLKGGRRRGRPPKLLQELRAKTEGEPMVGKPKKARKKAATKRKRASS